MKMFSPRRVRAPIVHRGAMLCVVFVALIINNMTLAQPTSAATGNGSPGDTNIAYVGRWDTSSSSTYVSYWGGAYFKTNVTGTTVQIKLAASTNIYVSLDGGSDTAYSNVSGTVNLTSTALASGTHTVRVAAKGWDDSIQFQGLVLDSGATTQAPTSSSKILEFVGDSITAGYLDTKNALSDYAWVAGEQLHAEHTQIAYPGICLVDNYACYSPNTIGMSKQFFKLRTVTTTSSPDWDFSRYQAAAVIINIGTNDSFKSVDDATFQSTYVTFLQTIRAKYANAPILVMRTFGGYKATPTQAAVNARNTAGDNNVFYIDTSNWLSSSDFVSDGLHPSDAGQIKAANQLAPIIASHIGDFVSNFDTGQPQPDWSNSSDNNSYPFGGVNNVIGICCSLTGPETGTRTNEVAYSGTTALVYSGKDTSTSYSYAYEKVFDLSSKNLTVTTTTRLSYWIYPQSPQGTTTGAGLTSGNNSTCVAIDLMFVDSSNNYSNLRDSGATDQHGNRAHPAYQCGHLTVDSWNQVIVNLSVASGKKVYRLTVAYDQPGNTGGYRGYIDDIAIAS